MIGSMSYLRGRDEMRMYRSLSVAVVAAALIAAAADPACSRGLPIIEIHVSNRGDDRADGSSREQAVKSLERARTLARQASSPATIYVAGTFIRSEPLLLEAVDAGLTIQSEPGAKASLTAEAGTAAGFMIIGADSVTISGFTISGFSEDGILIRNAKSVTVKDNLISDIRSASWSQGAIHFTGTVSNGVIVGNRVSGTDYAGIIVDTTGNSDVTGIRIIRNIVTDTCRKIDDCGAIYINDRSRKSRDILIAHNTIARFGQPPVNGRAVYLDDWASNVTVQENTISGPGRYAFQIHGGHDNHIIRNNVDLVRISQALFYLPGRNDRWEAMVSNAFLNNVFCMPEDLHFTKLAPTNIPTISIPTSEGNKVRDAAKCFRSNEKDG